MGRLQCFTFTWASLKHPSHKHWTWSPSSWQDVGLTCDSVRQGPPLFLKERNRAGFTAANTEDPDVQPVLWWVIQNVQGQSGKGSRSLLLFYCAHSSKASACNSRQSQGSGCVAQMSSQEGLTSKCVWVCSQVFSTGFIEHTPLALRSLRNNVFQFQGFFIVGCASIV